MSRNAYPLGAIDKNGVNVKTAKGWKGLVSHFEEVNPRLHINRKHSDRIREVRRKTA